MDTACLQHCLTEEERMAFDRDGYFIVPNAISPEMVTRLNGALDRLAAHYRAANGIDPHASINILNFIGKDEAFLELLDCPTTLPKVWGILGWNIQLYHSHTIVTPPRPEGQATPMGTLNWHQDSGRLNRELETTPQPRISLKVAFFLTDTSEPGRANLYVLPGSHTTNTPPVINGHDPEGTVIVRAKPGDAVFFDRRIWHRSSTNTWTGPRKVLFYGYSYRWLRPRDDMTVEHYFERCNPIQRQLLGYSPSGGHGYSSPRDEDVPLRGWIREHLGEAAVMA